MLITSCDNWVIWGSESFTLWEVWLKVERSSTKFVWWGSALKAVIETQNMLSYLNGYVKEDIRGWGAPGSATRLALKNSKTCQSHFDSTWENRNFHKAQVPYKSPIAPWSLREMWGSIQIITETDQERHIACVHTASNLPCPAWKFQASITL